MAARSLETRITDFFWDNPEEELYSNIEMARKFSASVWTVEDVLKRMRAAGVIETPRVIRLTTGARRRLASGGRL